MRDLAAEFTARTVEESDLGARCGNCDSCRGRYIGMMGPAATLIEGAIFAFVSDAGTDPEIILVLEAIKAGEQLTWRYRTDPCLSSLQPGYVPIPRERNLEGRCAELIPRGQWATRTTRMG